MRAREPRRPLTPGSPTPLAAAVPGVAAAAGSFVDMDPTRPDAVYLAAMPDDSNWYAPPADGSAPSSSSSIEAVDAEYAGFGVRAGARLIDVVMTLVFGVIGGAAGGFLTAMLAIAGVVSPGWLERIQGLSVGSFAFSLLAAATYHALAEAFGGATVGKALLGLRVVREDLGPCGLGGAIKRNILYFVDSLFFGLVGYSVMNNSRFQQRLGDMWGQTVVVRVASLPANLRGGVALGIALGIVGYVVIATASIVVRAM